MSLVMLSSIGRFGMEHIMISLALNAGYSCRVLVSHAHHAQDFSSESASILSWACALSGGRSYSFLLVLSQNRIGCAAGLN